MALIVKLAVSYLICILPFSGLKCHVCILSMQNLLQSLDANKEQASRGLWGSAGLKIHAHFISRRFWCAK